MTTYYRSRDVLITDEVFVARGATPARMHRIADLTSVGMVRATTPGFTGGPTVALGTGAAAAASWPVIGSTVALSAGMAPLALGVGVAAVLRRSGGPSWELHATVGGLDLVLYTNSDGQTFRQVKRALVRALEAHDPSRDAEAALRATNLITS
jgi:hypothetical protein